jgi:predicted RNA-binding Zn ribbon-like protein
MKSTTPVTIEAHEFSPRDFIGGDAALDFVNTVTGRDQTPRDWLDSYSRLIDWAGHVQLAPAEVLRTLKRKASSKPDLAAAALERAKELREALFDLVTRIVAGEAPSRNGLALLRERWLGGVQAHELRFDHGKVLAQLREDAVDLDLIAALVAYRMVEQVLPQPGERLRKCEGPNCSWLFLDSSKAGRRRWCDMAVCGNAAKSRRFTARAKRARRTQASTR